VTFHAILRFAGRNPFSPQHAATLRTRRAFDQSGEERVATTGQLSGRWGEAALDSPTL
jgi:hypothetical protein